MVEDVASIPAEVLAAYPFLPLDRETSDYLVDSFFANVCSPPPFLPLVC